MESYELLVLGLQCKTVVKMGSTIVKGKYGLY